jgi:hypothetical protein
MPSILAHLRNPFLENINDIVAFGLGSTVGIIGSFPLTSGSHFKVLDGIHRI